MEASRLARCAREEADKVRNYSTAKVPDGLENGKRFYEYVKKHASHTARGERPRRRSTWATKFPTLKYGGATAG